MKVTCELCGAPGAMRAGETPRVFCNLHALLQTTPVRLWLDDERPAPVGWIRCRWPNEVVWVLKNYKVSEVSLDHDLGDDARGTGYDVLVWLEQAVALDGFRPPTLHVHSANPAARARMLAAVSAILSSK